MGTTKRTESTSARVTAGVCNRKTAKKPRSAKVVHSSCNVLMPRAEVLLPDGSKLSETDIGLVEPRTGMLIVRVDVERDTVELSYTGNV